MMCVCVCVCMCVCVCVCVFTGVCKAPASLSIPKTIEEKKEESGTVCGRV